MLRTNPATDRFSKTVKWVQLIFFAGLVLYFGKTLFVPLLYGLLTAIIFYPVCKKMEARSWPRSVSIGVLLSIVFLFICGIIWLLGIEIKLFIQQLPAVSNKLSGLFPQAKRSLQNLFQVTAAEQAAWIQQQIKELKSASVPSMKGIFSAGISSVLMFLMVPVYASLFLYHRESFVRSLVAMAGKRQGAKLQLILKETVYAYYKFITGSFYVYCITGLLNSVGLLALGVENAILYGMLCSLMMVIPYVGIFISSAIPVSVALVTMDSIWYPVGVVVVIGFVQYLEENVIFPKIVGGKLNLSTMATLVAIVAGVVFWGVAGMVLATPVLSLIKIISDHYPEWKALNILINREEGYQGHKKRGSPGEPLS